MVFNADKCKVMRLGRLSLFTTDILWESCEGNWPFVSKTRRKKKMLKKFFLACMHFIDIICKKMIIFQYL